MTDIAARHGRAMTTATPDVVKDLHRRMVRIRHFEENCGRLSETGKLPGFLHLYVSASGRSTRR